MSTYNEYIYDVSRGVHHEQHVVIVYMTHDWSNRVYIIREHINVEIPSYANIETSYDSINDETRICFKWLTIEKGII